MYMYVVCEAYFQPPPIREINYVVDSIYNNNTTCMARKDDWLPMIRGHLFEYVTYIMCYAWILLI